MKWILLIPFFLSLSGCKHEVIAPREVIAAPPAFCPGSIDVTTTKMTCYYVPKH